MMMECYGQLPTVRGGEVGEEEHGNMGTLFLGIYPLDKFMMVIEREHVSISFFFLVQQLLCFVA